MIKFGYTSSDPLVDTFVILQPTYNSLVSNVNHTRYMEWCVPDYFSLAFVGIFACSGEPSIKLRMFNKTTIHSLTLLLIGYRESSISQGSTGISSCQSETFKLFVFRKKNVISNQRNKACFFII